MKNFVYAAPSALRYTKYKKGKTTVQRSHTGAQPNSFHLHIARETHRVFTLSPRRPFFQRTPAFLFACGRAFLADAVPATPANR